MGSIGTVTTSILRGVPTPVRQRVVIWQVPGINGYGAMTLGTGDSEFMIDAVFYCADDAAADAAIAAVIALQGTIITITDDWGNTWPNALIVRVEQPVKEPMIWGGYSTAVRMETKLKCLTTQ